MDEIVKSSKPRIAKKKLYGVVYVKRSQQSPRYGIQIDRGRRAVSKIKQKGLIGLAQCASPIRLIDKSPVCCKASIGLFRSSIFGFS